METFSSLSRASPQLPVPSARSSWNSTSTYPPTVPPSPLTTSTTTRSRLPKSMMSSFLSALVSSDQTPRISSEARVFSLFQTLALTRSGTTPSLHLFCEPPLQPTATTRRRMWAQLKRSLLPVPNWHWHQPCRPGTLPASRCWVP